PNSVLKRVPAVGGSPAAFGTLGPGAASQRWPQALPGGKLVLYTEHTGTANWDAANLVVAPLSGGAPTIVVHGGYYGRYVPGHLIYVNQGTLFAVPFDLSRLTTLGPAVPAIEGIVTNPASYAGAQVATASDGTLVFVPGNMSTTASSIEWL